MSIPAQAKLPVPARNCQRPCWKRSACIASRFHGSRPSTNGVIARTAASTEAASAPLHASPQPTSPSSVSTRTRMSVTPSRATWLDTSRCRYGTDTIVVSTRATLIPHLLRRGPRAGVGPRDRLAAVDDDRLAGDVLQVDQRQVGRGQVLGRAEPVEHRRLLQPVVPAGHVRPLAHVARRRHVAGRDRVDADPVRAERGRQRPHQAEQARLRGRVRRQAVRGERVGGRGERDRAVAVAGAQVRQRGAHRDPGRDQVLLERARGTPSSGSCGRIDAAPSRPAARRRRSRPRGGARTPRRGGVGQRRRDGCLVEQVDGVRAQAGRRGSIAARSSADHLVAALEQRRHERRRRGRRRHR